MSVGKFCFHPKHVNESLQCRFDDANDQLNLHCKLNKRFTNKKCNAKQAIKYAKNKGIITNNQVEKFNEIHIKGNKGKHSFHFK